MPRNIVLLLIAVLALSLVTSCFEAANAQTKPSIPEFTLQTLTQGNATIIVLTIQNQPFDEAASQYPDGFFYNVAVSVDGGNWSNLYHVEDADEWYPEQSKGSITVLTYVAGETVYYPREQGQTGGRIPTVGDIAFEVQAMIGHRERGSFQNGLVPYVLVGQKSDWSNAQTVTLRATPTPTPNQPTTAFDASGWVIVIVAVLATVVAVAVVTLLVFRRKSGIQ
jgi:hypothetical protein